ncbi:MULTISPECIES: right-handed parallel beta-helix repeat-containing protein [unclassified Mucilaginibacter]|uniref:right-handed parallel beta-helix repeat-containing protein n=1 Tax=unclassified Mucilaginibacter TaxID=2617802 RepID=UPI002AC8E3C4|nr:MULTISPECIES: right-handed parallel beta-helix repeat-containing protein [unclassified Mucilaginibacter]MEB0260198.1 right-handed parallel beta-helix repeat-containing protein [Mucilaginibacter sp. 10I4]MEB0277391.1 right-handed parallel beta-helix repeat-containing protein [Mucilaginibacter sp. 10B2]MEB0300127.1 right-handed parallel beta-helix repeat-containing protein [Mucilaginibacter sp. 5C4]WPX25515.1 right-handed parallel beta-helix repeat-containing protein [Mucilaginibacter sp. 5C4]
MKRYLVRWMAGVMVVLSFVMCSKDVAKIIKTADTTPLATATGPTPNAGNPTQTISANTCSYTVKASDWSLDGATFGPGSVICIPAGTRGALLLKNFKGTAASPITIINKGGRVTFTAATTASYAFKTQNCQYIKILGNGAAGVKYGFDVNGGNIGITMDDLSSDFEIANVEVRNSGFAGIMAKTDPSCDVATQRGHFTMRNVSLHDNYVHKTGGEGLYIGNSFYADGVSIACGKVLPHDVVNVKVYNNQLDSTGCEGIQVGSAISDCEIYSNTIKSPGLKPFASGQDNGIQIGEGTGGKCYGNLIKDAPGNGIIVLGLGDNVVFNNYILNARTHGIFADSRYTPGPGFVFINNTIVAPAQNGIKLNSETIPMNTVINNVIINPGAGVAIAKKSTDVKLTAFNNYSSTDINTCKFINYGGGDFHLLLTSPLINAGANTAVYGVTTDYFGKARPSGAYAIGATEY